MNPRVCSIDLKWEPCHQGERAGVPCHPGARAFFLLFYILGKLILYFLCFSSLSPLFLSFSVHTVWVLFSLINFTKVNCEQ